ncbi:hypothetical protein AOL_s00140g22 [Orbilia oligospora ATCC 24927]|uniref:Uncharacterized protein n=2 Tax=Orbilia oligospora TaxID=2813651 RepID=G1XM53_ARTOA|nr:hypothetical protein AOL_s00140g22 [Orbilia oligospora ATCC 24927]EGX45706.1 hypothetical protein AOL_s00140g22 [Orbilia oligospora ATCC 24927]KAF3272427.1 hypothetical protein TWF970_010053 [Orbilia oligospora]
MVTIEESLAVSKGLSTESQIPESPTSAAPSEKEQINYKESLEKETPKQCGCGNKTIRRELSDIDILGFVFAAAAFLAVVVGFWPLVPEKWHHLGYLAIFATAGFSLAENKYPEVRGHTKKGLWAAASVVAIYIFLLMGDGMGPNGAIRWAGKVLIQKAGLEAPSGLLDSTTTLPPTITIIITTTTTTPVPTVVYIMTTAYRPSSDSSSSSSSSPSLPYTSSTLSTATRKASNKGCECPDKGN